MLPAASHYDTNISIVRRLITESTILLRKSAKVGTFAQRIEGKMEPGENVTLHFDGYGSCTVYVEAATPHSYFAYR